MRLPAAKWLAGPLAGLVVLAPAAAAAAEHGFPEAGDFLLEAQPMNGSKRLPILYLESPQDASISLWCNRVDAKLIVVGNTVTIILAEPKAVQQCEPERMQADEKLVAALQQVQTWQRDDDLLVFEGADEPLRFRLSSH